ncbi:MAG: hypothetical protein SGBAC_003662 [Bacillariaceae sp.]
MNPLRILSLILLLVIACDAFAPASMNTRSVALLRMSEEAPEPAKDETPAAPPVKCPDCDICDGSGRITGGLGAVFDWFPVKAYRPCPNYIDKGGFYSRSGQGLDEIAFGRDSTFKSSGDN